MMGNFGPTFFDMGGVTPEDLTQGTYLLSSFGGGSRLYDKPPLHSMDIDDWLFAIENHCWASFHFTFGIEAEYIAAAVGPAAGYQFTAAGNLDSNGTSIKIYDDRIDSGVEFGFQLNVNYLFSLYDNYGWTCSDDESEVETRFFNLKGSDSFDLIPLIKLAAGAAGISFDPQKIDANIFAPLNQTWGFVDPPHSGNVTKFTTSVYVDLISVMINELGPLGLALKIVRAACSLEDIYFKTGPGLAMTMQTTITPTQILAEQPDPSWSILKSNGGGLYTGNALSPATPDGIWIWMDLNAEVGYGLTWVTQLGLDGFFDETWQVTIDTTQLFNLFGQNSPLTFPNFALTPFGNRVPGSAPAVSAGPGAPLKARFAPAGDIR